MKKLTKKDNIIFILLAILFIWVAGLTAYSLWQFNGIEFNHWYMLRDVKDQGLKIERLQEQIK